MVGLQWVGGRAQPHPLALTWRACPGGRKLEEACPPPARPCTDHAGNEPQRRKEKKKGNRRDVASSEDVDVMTTCGMQTALRIREPGDPQSRPTLPRRSRHTHA